MTSKIPPGNLNNYTLIRAATKISFDLLGDAFRSLGNKRNRIVAITIFRVSRYIRGNTIKLKCIDRTGSDAKSTSFRYETDDSSISSYRFKYDNEQRILAGPLFYYVSILLALQEISYISTPKQWRIFFMGFF